jgi:hypothetical protein
MVDLYNHARLPTDVGPNPQYFVLAMTVWRTGEKQKHFIYFGNFGLDNDVVDIVICCTAQHPV